MPRESEGCGNELEAVRRRSLRALNKWLLAFAVACLGGILSIIAMVKSAPADFAIPAVLLAVSTTAAGGCLFWAHALGIAIKDIDEQLALLGQSTTTTTNFVASLEERVQRQKAWTQKQNALMAMERRFAGLMLLSAIVGFPASMGFLLVSNLVVWQYCRIVAIVAVIVLPLAWGCFGIYRRAYNKHMKLREEAFR